MTVNWGSLEPVIHHENQFQKALKWAKAHQEMMAIVGIITLLLAIGIPWYLHSLQQSDKDAQNFFNMGQQYLRMPIDPKTGFKTETDRDQMVLQTFQRIVTDYPGTPTSKIARYYVARTQYMLGQFDQAYSNFDVASSELQKGPLGDEAYFGKILCREGQNQWPQASTLAETFLKDHPDSFMVPQVRLSLADIYAKNNNKDKAQEELKLIVKDYPDSNWSREADRRLMEPNS